MLATVTRLSARQKTNFVFTNYALKNRVLSNLPPSLLQVERPKPGSPLYATDSTAATHRPMSTNTATKTQPLLNRSSFELV